MIRPRVIPVLQLKNGLLYKSVNFKNEQYVGDPINTVKIFNEKEVDELVILDTHASKQLTEPNYDLIEAIASEAFMPIGYGGGIKSLAQAKCVINAGVEKIIINSAAVEKLQLIEEIAAHFGSQSVVVAIDVKKKLLGGYAVYDHTIGKSKDINLKDYLTKIQQAGAGEVIINSVDQDGVMSGYDIKLFSMVSNLVTIPVVALGGAGSLQHMRELLAATTVSAVAAGSMFVFYGKHRAVLITYPSYTELCNIKI